MNSGSNTCRLFRPASSALAPSALICSLTIPEIPSLSPAVAPVGFGRLLLGQVSSSAVAMAATYNRDSKGFGCDRREVGPAFLSPAHDLQIHLSSSESEHAGQEDDRLQARQRDVNLEFVIGSLGPTWDTQLNGRIQSKETQSSSKAEDVLTSFAKKKGKKVPIYLLGWEGDREGALRSHPSPPLRVVIVSWFFFPGACLRSPNPHFSLF